MAIASSGALTLHAIRDEFGGPAGGTATLSLDRITVILMGQSLVIILMYLQEGIVALFLLGIFTMRYSKLK